MAKFSFFFLFIFACAFVGHAQKTDEALIRAAFEGYCNAAITNNGSEALKYLDTRTVQYYGYVLDLSINADSAKVAALPLYNRLMVFTVRHRTSKQDLLSFDGKGLLVYALNSGLVGKSSMSNVSLGTITVNGNTAGAQMLVNAKPSPVELNFNKEEGQWKLNITSILNASGVAFQKLAEQLGTDSNELIFSALEKLSGKKPGPEIWMKVAQ